MRKSVIEPQRALKDRLFLLGNLVTNFQQKKADALCHWILWLEESEALLEKYNYAECAELAGLRALILSKLQCMDYAKRSDRKKQQLATALESVNTAQSVLMKKHQKLEAKVEQARSVIKQIVIMAKRADVINYDETTDFTAYLESLLLQFRQHEQLGASINNTVALIGKSDVLRILAEEI